MTAASIALIVTSAAALCLLPAVMRRAGLKLNSKQAAGVFLTFCALALSISMIYQPKIVFDGATIGLKAWWNIVFPSLLPFFIASELLMDLGLVKFMGVLLEPVMRPLFNVPGCGSFVLCIGYTSGYPIGAMVTARLRAQGLCTRIEAERLMSFTNNSSPLFMIVAVSVGMFGRPDLGLVIAGAHYLSNLTLGLLLRFYGRHDREKLPGPASQRENNILSRAYRELIRAWQQENRPLGKIISDAVHNSVNNLLNIGGFIILFSVIIRLLTAAGFIDCMAGFLSSILLPLGFSPEIMPALASGFFEMTIGCKTASESVAPIIQQVAAVEMILAWSGLSVHAQVASMISGTDIRMFPFICVRIAHVILSAIYTVFLFSPAAPLAAGMVSPVTAGLDKFNETAPMLVNLELAGIMTLLAISGLFGLFILYIVFKKVEKFIGLY
jgi:sporulation integral membrane protein YlbJ